MPIISVETMKTIDEREMQKKQQNKPKQSEIKTVKDADNQRRDDENNR